jgi:flagellar biosynthesis/type III secretory pathway protein FliH
MDEKSNRIDRISEAEMSEQPQEWWPKYVHELMNGIGADARIADLHNAALAAEREKWKSGAEGAIRALREHHSEELAAEREKRERAEKWSETLAKLADDNTTSYNASLAEVREKGRQEGYAEGWQAAVEELTTESKTLVRAVLAKVKEQPVQVPTINEDPIIELK